MPPFQIAAMSSGNGDRAEETPRSVGPEGSSAASAIAGEFPLSDKAGLCRGGGASFRRLGAQHVISVT